MHQLPVPIMDRSPSKVIVKKPSGAQQAGADPFRPSRGYFQDLLEALDLSGHYKGQVEAFYWHQRRVVRQLKAVRPKMTVSQARNELRDFNDDLPTTGPKKWQAALLELLLKADLVKADLVKAAFQDIAARKESPSSD